MNDTMRWHGNDIPKITVREDIEFDGVLISAGTEVWLFAATSILDEEKIELKVVCEDGTELYLPEEYLNNFKSKP